MYAKKGYDNYKEQTVNSMTSGELLLLLYDELVKRGTLAKISLDKQDYITFEAAIERCIAIIAYLDETLDRSYEVSKDIARMYEYFLYSLGRVKIGRNGELLERIRPMFAEFRDTFRQAEKESSSSRQSILNKPLEETAQKEEAVAKWPIKSC